ncbi:uncharacterized protein N7469_002080 [Penicillium citrinum]|uniref:Uncharacterized protein n=1 Tax=Penicillium citrinum TaxID=5077 RepID=A0A9W9TUZ8_PENCI|nr:uncharacterized protein N7469_002080 [Penicillium citrinum]KAJ5240489.1 hypothetical protein N7469_002080 [Penicillium citrinum]
MDTPYLPPSIERPTERQRRFHVYLGDDAAVDLHGIPPAISMGTSHICKVRFFLQKRKISRLIDTVGSLTAEAQHILYRYSTIARSALNMLDLFLCPWKCYVVKSAEQIPLEDEYIALLQSKKLLKCEIKLLQQRCEEQVLLLWHRRQTAHAIQDAVLAVLKEMNKASSDLPAVPPCIATEPNDIKVLSIDSLDTSGSDTYGFCVVDYLFYPNHGSHQGFPWTGPDPLSPTTQADDLFLYLSAFLLPQEITWVEFRLSRHDPFSDDFLGEYLFFVPRTGTSIGNLSRIRRQILDLITQSCTAADAAHFRLSIWPRLDPIPYTQHSELSLRSTLPTMPCLDPEFFVNNIRRNFR